MNGSSPLESNVVFRTIITAMFAVLMAMGGYIVTNLNTNVDKNFVAVGTRIDVEAGRSDRINNRLNEIDNKLAIIEYRLDHPGR